MGGEGREDWEPWVQKGGGDGGGGTVEGGASVAQGSLKCAPSKAEHLAVLSTVHQRYRHSDTSMGALTVTMPTFSACRAQNEVAIIPTKMKLTGSLHAQGKEGRGVVEKMPWSATAYPATAPATPFPPKSADQGDSGMQGAK